MLILNNKNNLYSILAASWQQFCFFLRSALVYAKLRQIFGDGEINSTVVRAVIINSSGSHSISDPIKALRLHADLQFCCGFHPPLLVHRFLQKAEIFHTFEVVIKAQTENLL